VSTLLHLDSSANRSGESVTRELTALFAHDWLARHDCAAYQYRDLAAESVPPVDTAYCQLGRRAERHGLVGLDEVAALAENPAEERAWALTLPLIREVRAADVVLIGAPMYNLSVSALLKGWIDRVTFPGGFTDRDTGSSVLAKAHVVLVMARGGAYGPGMPGEALDFQAPYLHAYFRKQGVPDQGIHMVSADLTLAGFVPGMANRLPEAERCLKQAYATLTSLAASLE
jgi:FMN-dependent NADH-azoreductase